MADKYVATTGNDTNPGTLASPYLTIRKGIENTVAGNGDTVYVRSGTYAETISTEVYTIPSGTSFSNALTVKAYPGETVTIAPTTGYGIRITGSTRYVIFKDFVLDCSGGTDEGVSIGDNDATNVPSYIRIENVEIKNADVIHKNGILAWAGSGRVGIGHHEFINCHVHHCGTSLFGHGIYITVPDCLVDRCTVHDNAAFGIHVFANASFPLEQTHRTVVQKCKSYSNVGPGILITGGNNLKCFNSIAYSNGGAGIIAEFGSSCNLGLIYNCTSYGNGDNGIRIGGNQSNAQIKNCISYGNSGSAISNAGSATVQENNLTAAGADFRLQAGSPAIDAAQDLSAYFQDDFYGNARV